MRSLFALLCAAMLSTLFAVSGIAAEKKDTPAKAETTKAATTDKKAATTDKNATTADKKGDKASTPKSQLVDLNTATEAELKAIPGIGDTYAKKIIEGRPYVKKDQLVSRKILPKAVYDKVKDKIIAKHAK